MISICLLAFSAILIPLLTQFDICHRFIQHSAWMQVSWYTRLFLCFKKASSMNNVLLSLFLVLWCTMSLFSLAFWAIVVPWLQYLPEIHFWCVYELRDMSQHAVCCVSMMFLWWCIMYYHHYALYYDKSCQCAVQCTVILILLPVMWRPHFWIPLMMMTMEVAERALYCDSSILSDWRVKSHGWRVKKRKMRLSYCYNTNTNWKFQIECWKIAIIGGHQLLLSSERSANFLRRKLSLERKYIFWRSL